MHYQKILGTFFACFMSVTGFAQTASPISPFLFQESGSCTNPSQMKFKKLSTVVRGETSFEIQFSIFPNHTFVALYTETNTPDEGESKVTFKRVLPGFWKETSPGGKHIAFTDIKDHIIFYGSSEDAKEDSDAASLNAFITPDFERPVAIQLQVRLSMTEELLGPRGESATEYCRHQHAPIVLPEGFNLKSY